MWKLRLAALAVLLCCAHVSHARVTKAFVWNDDRPWILLSKPFGFSSDAHFSLQVSNVKVHWAEKAEKDYARLGFYIIRTTEEEAPYQDPEDDDKRCNFLTNGKIQTEMVVNFQQQKLQDIISTGEGQLTVSRDWTDSKGVYAMVFANCADDTVVTFEARVEFYNKDTDGEANYLSVGEQELPAMYLAMCVLFTCGLGLWAWTIYQMRTTAHAIHYLMALLALFKVLTLLTQAGVYHFTRIAGSPDGWNIAYYIFSFFRGVMFFSVVILIGTGWSYMKPFLGSNEKRILMFVIPLQVLANIAIVIMDENTPAQAAWFTWRDIMHLLDIICCCAVLFPIVWSITHLREAARTDGKAARSVQKLTLFRQFYVLVVVYIYFTRIVVYILQTTLPYERSWMSNAASEAATLAFYALTAWHFRPHKENPYFTLSDQELEAAGIFVDDD